MAKSREETSAEFEERFSAMSSSAYTLMGVALGTRLGLFHKMTLMEKPWTLRELAEAGNYANPVYGVATICHQVRWLRWGIRVSFIQSRLF